MDTQAAVPQQLTEQESIRREKLAQAAPGGAGPLRHHTLRPHA